MNGQPLIFSEPNVVFTVIDGCNVRINFLSEDDGSAVERVKNILISSASKADFAKRCVIISTINRLVE